MGAARSHAFRRGPQDFDDYRFIVAAAAADTLQEYRFTGQRPVDEHGFPVYVRDAAAIVIQRNDLGSFRRGSRFQAATHARANCIQCGSVRSRSQSRTRFSSAA